MAHGYADWGGLRPRVVTFGGIDLDEVAARLGSPSWYDRRGEVVWYDQFEYGIEPWTIETTGAGGGGEDATNVWLTKGHSLKLVTGTGEGVQTQAERTLFMPQLTRIGLEGSVCFGLGVDYCEWVLTFLDGTYLQSYLARLDVGEGRIYIYIGGDGWTNVLADVVYSLGAGVFYPIKIVVDATARKWVRLLFANQEVDIGAYSGVVTEDGRAPTLNLSFFVGNADEASRAMFIDNVLLTQDEP